MSYSTFSAAYKVERMRDIISCLEQGNNVNINGLFLEEIKWLKKEYGAHLKKTFGFIYLDF